MKFGFKQIILSTVFAGLAVPAFAQTADNPFDRGRYAGPVGWVDHAGDGDHAGGAAGLHAVELAARLGVLHA